MRCRSSRCQLTIAVGQQSGFHFTIPIIRLPVSFDAQNSPLSADNRCRSAMPAGTNEQIIPLSADNCGQSAVRDPFHDTDNRITSRRWGAAHPAVSSQGFISRYRWCVPLRSPRYRSLCCQLTIATVFWDRYLVKRQTRSEIRLAFQHWAVVFPQQPRPSV